MRYTRQEVFIGKDAQTKLQSSVVSIIGLGALGTVSAELLARSGVSLILIDRDLIELSNLQRQTLFSEGDIRKPKAIVTENKIKKINSKIKIKSYFENLDYNNISLIKSDLILDCTDNLETRFLINEFSIKNKIPFIFSSAIRDEGYLFNVLDKPCLKCILKNSKTTETCETAGVLNTTTNTISSIQVNEAIKILTKNKPERDLLHINLTKNTIKKIKVKPSKFCQVCRNKFELLSGKKQKVSNFCSAFIFKEKFDYYHAKSELKKLGAKEIQGAIVLDKITVFPNSILIKTNSIKEAKSIYSRYIGN